MQTVLPKVYAEGMAESLLKCLRHCIIEITAFFALLFNLRFTQESWLAVWILNISKASRD